MGGTVLEQPRVKVEQGQLSSSFAFLLTDIGTKAVCLGVTIEDRSAIGAGSAVKGARILHVWLFFRVSNW